MQDWDIYFPVKETDLPRLQLTALSYRWKAIQYWNALPQYLRAETSLTRFKSGLKKWMKERLTEDRTSDAQPTSQDNPQDDALPIQDRPSSQDNPQDDVLPMQDRPPDLPPGQ